ncbi:hypothetical protein MVEN_01886700 [Mycena venus]|uniref:Uncharacterized protein n=1 Tax=Mycena venus TaxID=2733690 RepID=A0A8H6XH99_9AGAR|nr:hypothetical protein MVEN_01886700 [Mycena venus]
MSASLSDTQPFDSFLEKNPTLKPNFGPAPTTTHSAASDIPPAVPATGATPLSDDLKKSLGPSSGTRSVARTSKAPAVVPYSPASLVPTRVVDTFEHYKLTPPPILEKPKKETAANMTICTEHNLALLADIVGVVDTRVEKLSRRVDNLGTETQLRDAVRNSRTKASGQEDAPLSIVPGASTEPASPASPASSHPSSVDGFDPDDQFFARLEDVEHKADDALDMSHAHERALKDLESRVEAPFTLAQLSDAMKKQFTSITQDRDILARRIESDRTDQAKINRVHEATVAGLQDDIRKLQATIARLELSAAHAPLAPRSSEPSHFHTRSPPRQVSPLPRRRYSRSRSPGEPHGDSKRSRSSVEARSELVEIVMGPISLALSLPSRELFELHLRTALPNHPSLGQCDVHRSGEYLHIRGLPSGEAHALTRAWDKQTVVGYKNFMMTIARDGPNRNANVNGTASGSTRRLQSNSHARRNGGGGGAPRRSYPSR